MFVSFCYSMVTDQSDFSIIIIININTCHVMESVNQETVQQLRKEIEDCDRRISEVEVLVDEITKLMEKKRRAN